jgi:hypothetical protein
MKIGFPVEYTHQTNLLATKTMLLGWNQNLAEIVQDMNHTPAGGG